MNDMKPWRGLHRQWCRHLACRQGLYSLDMGSITGLLMIFSLFYLGGLDWWLLFPEPAEIEASYDDPFQWNRLPARIFVPLVTVYWAVHILLWLCLLAAQAPDRGRLRPAARLLRILLLGMPLIGLATLPWWRRVMSEQPAWAFGRPRPPGGPVLGSVCRGLAELLTWGGRRLNHPWCVIGLILSWLVPLLVHVPEPGTWRPLLIFLTFTAHGGMAGLVFFGIRDLPGLGGVLPRAFMAVWFLVPLPGAPMGALLIYALQQPDPEASLVGPVLTAGPTMNALPAWHNLEVRLRHATPTGFFNRLKGDVLQEAAIRPDTASLKATRLFMYLRLWALPAEAMVIGRLCGWLYDRGFTGSGRLVVGLVYLGIALFLVGTVLTFIGLARRMSSREKNLTPPFPDGWHWCVAATGVLLALGVEIGAVWTELPALQVRVVLLTFGFALAATVRTFGEVFFPYPDKFLWSRTLVSVVCALLGMMSVYDLHALRTLLEAACTFLVFLPWFGYRGLLRFAAAVRPATAMQRGLLVLGAVCPLGGMSVPWWIYRINRASRLLEENLDQYAGDTAADRA